MAQVGIVDIGSVRAAALVEHYQKTADLVNLSWERRNRQFIILVGILAAAVLVAFARQLIAPALESVILERLPGLDGSAVERLRAFLPLASDLLLALLLFSVFYLMASLCHRTGMIINTYQYLSLLEREIRKELKLAKEDVAVTREGPFYEITGAKLTRVIGFCYRVVLGVLLVSFFALRIYFDMPNEWVPLQVPGREEAVKWYGWLIGNLLFVIDILLALPTFWRYVRLRPLPDDDVRQAIVQRQGSF